MPTTRNNATSSADDGANAAQANSAPATLAAAAAYRNFRPKLLELNDDYDCWEQSLKNTLYAMDSLPLYNASLKPATDPGGTVSDTVVPPLLRRIIWGTINQSLSKKMMNKVRGVSLGEVEDLLRKIKNEFYRSTVVSKSKLKDQLHSLQLENYTDLSDYIAGLHAIVTRLQGLGYKVDKEDKEYYLLKGLPLDYSPVVQVIKIPRSPALTWDEIVYMLQDFADDPKVIGSTNKTNPKLNKVLTIKSDELCRNYALGKCRRGNRCRYRHEDQPGSTPRQRPKCTYCKRTGHMVDKCFKKQRDEDEKANKTKAASYHCYY
jgi:hypothetical protein